MNNKKKPQKSILWHVAIVTVSLAVVFIVSLLVYQFLLSPHHQQWGARPAEVNRMFPGDQLVPDADYISTHAVTIDAPVEQVWPWLVQLGQNRAGFYSYTFIENLMGFNIHNSDKIVPEWQTLKKGDLIHLTASTGMLVESIKWNRHVICRMPMGRDASWAFYVEPLDTGQTRFYARLRMKRLSDSLHDIILLDAGHFVMERRMMLVIKERAEFNRGIVSHFYTWEIIWAIALLMGLLMTAVLFFASNHRPWNLLFSTLLAQVCWGVLFCSYASLVAVLLIPACSIILFQAMRVFCGKK